MVEAAHFRELHDLTHLGRLHGPRLWRVLLEREVRSRTVVVAEVLAENPPQVFLPQHDDVVEALAAYGPDQSLDVRALPRKTGAR